jgi:hypothetical protein
MLQVQCLGIMRGFVWLQPAPQESVRVSCPSFTLTSCSTTSYRACTAINKSWCASLCDMYGHSTYIKHGQLSATGSVSFLLQSVAAKLQGYILFHMSSITRRFSNADTNLTLYINTYIYIIYIAHLWKRPLFVMSTIIRNTQLLWAGKTFSMLRKSQGFKRLISFTNRVWNISKRITFPFTDSQIAYDSDSKCLMYACCQSDALVGPEPKGTDWLYT